MSRGERSPADMNQSHYDDKPVYRPPWWFWTYAVVMLVFIGWCIGMLT